MIGTFVYLLSLAVAYLAPLAVAAFAVAGLVVVWRRQRPRSHAVGWVLVLLGCAIALLNGESVARWITEALI